MMSASLRIISSDESQTIALGRRLAVHFKRGDIVCLFGDLGSGKTTFVKGIAEALKVNAKKVNSPTFVFMNMYEGRIPVYHFDLYRIDDIVQLDTIGFDEFCYGQGVCLIEWAEKLKGEMPKEYLSVALAHGESATREVTVTAYGKRYEPLVKEIS